MARSVSGVISGTAAIPNSISRRFGCVIYYGGILPLKGESEMKAVISGASLLACAFSLNAQISGTLQHRPDGLDEVSIRNKSTASVVAYVTSVKRVPQGPNSSNAPWVMYSDPLIETDAKPLLAGEERSVMKMGMNPGVNTPGARFFQEPVVTAGILADGSVIGDPALLAGLVLRRSNMLLAIETTLETLSDAGRRNVPRDQLIAQFKKMADSLRRWYLPPEQQVGLSVYQSMIGKLMNLPDVQYGSPFPPATFVAEQTGTLRQQRVILSESQPSLADGNQTSR